MSCELFVGEDNLLALSGLKNSHGEYVNNAVVELSVSPGLAAQLMVYVEDSNGVYEYVVQNGAPVLTEDSEYEVTIHAEWDEDGDAKETELSETYLAVVRTRAYGTDVYATCDDLYMIFGRSNVDKWSDVDNDQDESLMRERKAWALHLASRELDDALRSGPYGTPFELPYPTTLIDATARLAGVLLYESRGLVDEESTSVMQPHRDRVLRFTKRVLGGQLIIGDKLATIGLPVVVKQVYD
jgi:phage gp36-like protein